MHARQGSKLLTYSALRHSSSSSVGRRLLVTSYGYGGWDKGWILHSIEALVRRVKVMCACSDSCACVYIGCVCVCCVGMCANVECVHVWGSEVDIRHLPHSCYSTLFFETVSRWAWSLPIQQVVWLVSSRNQLVSAPWDLGFPSVYVGAGHPIPMLAQKSLYPLSHLSSSYWHSCALETALPTCVSCTRSHAPICVCLRVSWMFVTCSPSCLRSCWAAVGVTWCPGVIFRVVLESR